MAEFPKRIDCGDFELIKPDATFDKAKEFFDIVTKNKEFLAEWLEWVGLYTRPEVAFNYLNSISDVKEPSYLIQVNGKVIGGHGFVDVNERYKIADTLGHHRHRFEKHYLFLQSNLKSAVLKSFYLPNKTVRRYRHLHFPTKAKSPQSIRAPQI